MHTLTLTLALLIAVVLIAAWAFIFRAKIAAYFKDTKAYRKWRQVQQTKMYQACVKEKHKLDPGAIGDKPAKICNKCGYILQISKQEFKSLFGLSHTMMKLKYQARVRREQAKWEAEALVARIEAKAQAERAKVADAVSKIESEAGGVIGTVGVEEAKRKLDQVAAWFKLGAIFRA